MNYFGIVSLFNGMVAFFAGLYPLLKDRKNPLYVSFSTFAFSVTLWAIFYSVWQSQSSKESALLFMRLLMMPTYCLPSSFLWFVLTLLEWEERKFYRLLLAVLPLFFLAFSFSELMVQDVVPRLYFPFWPTPGLFMHAFVFAFLGMVSYSFFLLFRAWINSTGLRRWQLRWVTLSTVFAFVGGSTNWFLWYDIPIPPIPNFFVGVFLLILAYAIIRRQLFDVDTLTDYIHEAKLSALGTLASALIHEIRTPLFVAAGHAESLLSNVKANPFPSEKIHQNVEDKLTKIINQMDRMADIMNRFTEFTKPGETLKKVESIPLAEVVDDALSMLGNMLGKEKIVLEKKVDPDAIIHSDRRDLEEILINLMTNAYQAMPEGGVLRITDERHNGFVRVSISDTGCGIPSTQLKRVFDPFFSTKKEKGTGLGLYIVKKLVERNNGKIKVASEVGRGTTFSIEFPLPNSRPKNDKEACLLTYTKERPPS